MVRRPARRLGPSRILLAALAWSVLLLVSLAPVMLAAGPPFGERPTGAGAHLVDDADVLPRQPQAALDSSLAAVADSTGTDIVIYLQVKPASRTREEATADAQALFDAWQVGGEAGDGAVLMIDFDRQTKRAVAAVVAGPGLAARVSQSALDGIVSDTMGPSLRDGAWLNAVTQGVVALSASVGGSGPVATPQPGPTVAPQATPEPGATAAPQATQRPTFDPSQVPDIGPAPAPGPPWPEPIDGVRVYDFADVLADDVVVAVGHTIADIDDRTGAQVVVYTQVKPESDTTAKAEQDAISLMDAWGIGRKGIDDGLLILFDLDETRCHGQVQLYAGPGYRASYLTNEDRQRIFDEAMVPNLRGGVCDFDSALLAAMAAIDGNATPQRAQALALARQVDAVTGLIVAPIVALGLLAWAGWSWLRYGKDPEVVDDPSVLMPAPPPGLTPAAAAVVLDGRAKRRALTTAMVDLAARGDLRFREAPPDATGRLAIDVLTPDENDPRVARNRRMPTGDAEAFALEQLRGIADARGRIAPDELPAFARHEEGFADRLEQHVAEQGWFREPPERSTDRWTSRAAWVLVLGVIGFIIAVVLPSQGLLLLGVAMIGASIGIFILARAMPQRTMQGAMVFAWLSAYQRTLAKTLEQSRTMEQVIASHAVPWLETPDQAVVWGYALGLHEEVEDVLARSVEVAGTRAGSSAWFPVWYVGSGGGAGSGSGMGPSGMFSSSTLPNFGAMTAALATIGSPPAASGSGGGSGSFGGGGSGGGGGGAGGGF